MFLIASSSRKLEPTVIRYSRRKSKGHHRRVESSLSVERQTHTESFSSAEMESTRHSLIRTKPCEGALLSSAFARNQGKQTGIPPRIARPASQYDFSLTN